MVEVTAVRGAVRDVAFDSQACPIDDALVVTPDKGAPIAANVLIGWRTDGTPCENRT